VLHDLDLAGIDASSRIVSCLAFAGPASRAIFRIAHRRRMKGADEQLPDALSLMGNALRAGLALPQAMEMAAIELRPPFGDEMKRALAQVKQGRTIEESLALLEKRLPTDDVGLFVQSVEVLRRAGGNLIETFAALSTAIEERRRVAERIRALTAQGIMQAAILLALPWSLAAALQLLAPEFIAPLFHTRLGWALLAATAMLEAIGALWLRKVVVIRV